MTLLIGIAGHAGAGKDTAAYYLHATQGAIVKHFATPLKAACAHMFGIPLNDFSDPARKNLVDPYWNMSPRMIAQYVGTELCREKLGSDFWIKRLCRDLMKLHEHDIVVIADVRFQNEVDFIFNSGGHLIHIHRPGCDGKVGIANHASEAGFTVPNGYGEYYTQITNDSSIYVFHQMIHSVFTKRVIK